METESKRRDRHDIIAQILDHAREGRIKTHLMYKAKLSYAQINEYLPLLIERGFLENMTFKRKKRMVTMYRTTQRGMDFQAHLELVDKLWTKK